MKSTRWQRFVCWLRGCRLDSSNAIGWSGYVNYTCLRCHATHQTRFDF